MPTFIRVCYSPKNTFACLKYRGRWFGAFVAYCCALVFIAYIQYPAIIEAVVQSQASADIDPARLQYLLLPLRRILNISMLCIPFLEFAKTAFLAMTIFAFCLACGVEDAEVRTALAAVCHCRMVIVLKVAYNTLLFHIHGTHGAAFPGLSSYTGINIFFEGKGVGVLAYTFLTEVSVFSIWYFALLTMALSAMFEISIRRGSLISSLILAITLMGKMALVVFSSVGV